MSIFSRGHYYDNCLVSVEQEFSFYDEPNIRLEFMHGPFKLEFMHGPFKLEYNGPQTYLRESFKGALERFAKKVAKDYDDYFQITDHHADCFETMIKDFETLECPYLIGDADD